MSDSKTLTADMVQNDAAMAKRFLEPKSFLPESKQVKRILRDTTS